MKKKRLDLHLLNAVLAALRQEEAAIKTAIQAKMTVESGSTISYPTVSIYLDCLIRAGAAKVDVNGYYLTDEGENLKKTVSGLIKLLGDA